MNNIFTSTWWRDTTRRMLVNNDRILYVERFENERVSYTVTFDNGHTLELDEPTGKMFCKQLEQLRRSLPMVHYARSDEDRPRPRFPRRQRAASSPTCEY